MSNTIIQATGLSYGEYLKTTKHKIKPKPCFRSVGECKMKAVEIIADMTVHEALVFKEIVRRMDYVSNIAEFSTFDLSKTDRVKWSKGYKSLESKNLLARLKKGRPSIYMLNPDLIQPKDYDKAVIKWNGSQK